jgi:hypothetical protein
MPTYIKIEAGEFGEMYTWAFMFHEDDWDIENLLLSFMNDITPKSNKYKIECTKKRCCIQQLDWNDLSGYESEFKEYLKKKGFKDLFDKATEIVFSD